MKKFLASALLITGLTIGGCTTLPPAVSTTITAVQQATVLACSFLPTAETVAGILAAGNPILQTAEAVAAAICGAVTPKASLKRRLTVPEVNGVVIHGTWVR